MYGCIIPALGRPSDTTTPNPQKWKKILYLYVYYFFLKKNCVFGCTYIVCRGQRSTLGISPWALCILGFLKQFLTALVWAFPAMLSWLAREPQVLACLYILPALPPSPGLGFHLCVTSPGSFTWVLGIQLIPSYSVMSSQSLFMGM